VLKKWHTLEILKKKVAQVAQAIKKRKSLRRIKKLVPVI
jgi:hypothetical protein